MDPDETLAEIRRLIAEGETVDDDARVLELVTALDEWITRGGFLPAAWTKEKNR